MVFGIWYFTLALVHMYAVVRLDMIYINSISEQINLRDEVMQLITYHTGVRFPSWCINTVHWLGGGHSLIIRFNNKEVRDEVYRNRVPKDVNKRGLFIHESLTPTKMALVSRCASLRREGKLATYFTLGGNVLVKKAREAPSILVSPDMTDDDILAKLSSQPTSYREAAAPTQPQTQEKASQQALPNQQGGGTRDDQEGPKPDMKEDGKEDKETERQAVCKDDVQAAADPGKRASESDGTDDQEPKQSVLHLKKKNKKSKTGRKKS